MKNYTKTLIILILFNFLLLFIKPSSCEQQIPQEEINSIKNKKIKYDPVEELQIGLIAKGQSNQKIPLKKLYYNVKISNSIAQIELYQEYHNQSPNNIETEYFFAIPPNAAFSSLEAQINGQILKGEIKEKEQAKQQYQEAVDSGKSAAYAEIIEELHDIMKLNIGNLKSDQLAIIKFVYLETLDIFLNKFWRLLIGNTFSSRSVDNTFVSPDLSKTCNPSTISSENEEAYNWMVEVDIQSPSEITFIGSPSHKIIVEYSKDKYSASIKLDIKENEQYPNKEFILLYQNQDINKPQIALGQTNDIDFPYAGILTFFPDFNNITTEQAYHSFLRKHKNNKFQDVEDENDQQFLFELNKTQAEYIFIVDRSGSMQNERIKMTKDVLIHLLDILQPNSKFQIISFGSHYTQIFENISVLATQYNIEFAKNQVMEFDANYGGTEVYFPLQQALSSEMTLNYPRNIFLITDGQVWNEDAIIRLVKSSCMKQNIRVYTVGIGNGVSKNLIRSIAEEGKGKYEFISEPHLMKQKLVKMLKDTISPFVDQLSIEGDEELIQIIAPLPETITSIRKNEIFTIFLFFSKGLEKVDYSNVFLQCRNSQTNEKKKFLIQVSPNQAINTTIFHKLGIHRLIKSILSNNLLDYGELNDIKMPDKKNYYNKIKNYSLRFQVLSELTAFVLIDHNNSNNNDNLIKPIKIDIPLIESIDYEQKQNIKQKKFHKSNNNYIFLGERTSLMQPIQRINTISYVNVAQIQKSDSQEQDDESFELTQLNVKLDTDKLGIPILTLDINTFVGLIIIVIITAN